MEQKTDINDKLPHNPNPIPFHNHPPPGSADNGFKLPGVFCGSTGQNRIFFRWEIKVRCHRIIHYRAVQIAG